MINSIIEGISISLNAEFGDNYTTYTESVEQGLKEPCFFVFCINPTNRVFLGKRYSRLIKAARKRNATPFRNGCLIALNISPFPGIWYGGQKCMLKWWTGF